MVEPDEVVQLQLNDISASLPFFTDGAKLTLFSGPSTLSSRLSLHVDPIYLSRIDPFCLFQKYNFVRPSISLKVLSSLSVTSGLS